MLIELKRAVPPHETDGEDDGVNSVPYMIAVNPVHVAAVHESLRDGSDVVIVKLADGRGYKIRGTYAEVMAKLNLTGKESQGG